MRVRTGEGGCAGSSWVRCQDYSQRRDLDFVWEILSEKHRGDQEARARSPGGGPGGGGCGQVPAELRPWEGDYDEEFLADLKMDSGEAGRTNLAAGLVEDWSFS